MPRLPRFDPLWLIIPAIALLIAVGWPTRVPINPRGSGPPATITAHTSGPASPRPGTGLGVGLLTSAWQRPGPNDTIGQALGVAPEPVATTSEALLPGAGVSPPRPCTPLHRPRAQFPPRLGHPGTALQYVRARARQLPLPPPTPRAGLASARGPSATGPAPAGRRSAGRWRAGTTLRAAVRRFRPTHRHRDAHGRNRHSAAAVAVAGPGGGESDLHPPGDALRTRPPRRRSAGVAGRPGARGRRRNRGLRGAGSGTGSGYCRSWLRPYDLRTAAPRRAGGCRRPGWRPARLAHSRPPRLSHDDVPALGAAARRRIPRPPGFLPASSASSAAAAPAMIGPRPERFRRAGAPGRRPREAAPGSHACRSAWWRGWHGRETPGPNADRRLPQACASPPNDAVRAA